MLARIDAYRFKEWHSKTLSFVVDFAERLPPYCVCKHASKRIAQMKHCRGMRSKSFLSAGGIVLRYYIVEKSYSALVLVRSV